MATPPETLDPPETQPPMLETIRARARACNIAIPLEREASVLAGAQHLHAMTRHLQRLLAASGEGAGERQQ